MARIVGMALFLLGGGLTAWLFVSLGFFFLTDGFTLGGENLRRNDEFYAYWTMRVLPITLDAAMVWGGVRLWRSHLRMD